MHPLLAERRRLGIYLLLWVPVAGLLAVLLARMGGLPAGAAVLLAVWLAAFFAFLSLGVWYACRALPLTTARLPRSLASHLMGAVATSALWVLSGSLVALLLFWLPGFAARVGPLYAAQAPLLFVLGVLFYLLAAAVHYLALTLAEARESERRALELRALAREAELRALRAQIDPHFLFNSLNSISALTVADPAAARAMCLRLSEFLRATLRLGARERIPLADELGLVRSFLAVERARFGARLGVEEEIAPEAERCLVPPLLLQPLVENAVRHGIAHLVEGGVVRLQAARRGPALALAVENSADPGRPRRADGGLGLPNARQRLQALFGPEAELRTREGDGRFRVEISLPARTAPEEAKG